MKIIKGRLLAALMIAAAGSAVLAQETESFTFTTNRVVPDGNASGLSDVRTINSAIGTITSIKVGIKIVGEFNGDLFAYVRHSGGFAVLLNRPGKTLTNAIGYADAGFDVMFQTGAANGDVHTYQGSTMPAIGSPLTGTWEPDGRTVDPAFVTDASTRAALLTSFNGLNASGEWTLYIADLESGGTNMLAEWKLEIIGSASPTLTWPNPADITYGTVLGATELNAVASHNGSTVPGTFTYAPASGAILNSGANQTLSVTFTPDDSTRFLPVTKNASINVLKAALTITAEDESKYFGEPLPSFTATYTGFVNGESPADLDTVPILNTIADAESPAGAYDITGSGAADANYAITFVNGTLTVLKSASIGNVSSSSNPAIPGSPVTFSFNVAAVPPGAGIPSGNVNFRITGSIAGTVSLSSGVASFTVNTLSVGTHSVVAEYPGDGNFVGITNTLSPSQLINTPPIAGADTIERYPRQTVKVRLAALLVNDSDADSDPLTASFGATSLNGGTVSVTGEWLFYLPAGGFTNSDSFTYTIADGRGGNTTGTVTVTIKPEEDEPSTALSIVDLGSGSFRIRIDGIPNRTYRIQVSESLSPATWHDLLKMPEKTADAAGLIEFTDQPGTSTFWYRSVYP
jgi:subtilisin-like proprotein convertase family protein